VIDDVGIAQLVTAAVDLAWTRDPFDRLLAAHSASRRLRFCTVDPLILEHHTLLVRELVAS
jgi:PIN domain nuclease of toxin-antitoxin system